MSNKKQLGFIKVKRTVVREGWLAWGAFNPLTTDQPLDEPSDPCHFTFSDDRQIAIDYIKMEMESRYGKVERDWTIQDD